MKYICKNEQEKKDVQEGILKKETFGILNLSVASSYGLY